MIIVCVALLVGIMFYSKPIIDINNNYSGLDERPIFNESKVDINIIRSHFFKLDMLKVLQSNSLTDNEKLIMINNFDLFDHLNPNVIRAPNKLYTNF